MDREGFRSRMKQYKKARAENPGLKYWEWKAQPAEKDIPKYDEGIDYVGENDNTVNAVTKLPWQLVHKDIETGQWDIEYNVPLEEVVVTADAPFKMPHIQKLSENNYLADQYFNDLLNRAKSGSKEEIKSIQRDLANRGMFDIDTTNMSKAEIAALQRKIGTAADGIWGKNSIKRNREYQIDGIWGKRTEQAFRKSLAPQWDDPVSAEDTEWCAEWVGKKATSIIGDRYKFGIQGDAWKMPKNIVQHGGEMIFNVYDESFKNVKTTTELKQKTEKALKTTPFDINNLKVGDIVGIYMPSSDMHNVALKEGSTHNTHIGIVTEHDKNGVPIIEHNIHRKLHRDKANRLTGSRYGRPMIATVTRPAYGNTAPAFETQDVKSQYTTETDSPLFVQFANSIAGGKELMQKLFPNVDIDEVERITLAVQGRETGFMKNKTSDQKGVSKLKNNLKEFYRDKIKEKDPETISSNLSKMKLSSFDSEERRMLGLKSTKDLEDPKKAGLAALYYMAKNYQYFANLQSMYPQLSITNDDLSYLTELSYNQGMRKLRHIGFTEEGLPAPEELKNIREMAKYDAKIKDVSSTNYAHLGELGKFLYDTFGEGHTPYIAAAEKYKRKLIDIAKQPH